MGIRRISRILEVSDALVHHSAAVFQKDDTPVDEFIRYFNHSQPLDFTRWRVRCAADDPFGANGRRQKRIIAPDVQCPFDNIFLVGDAAGFGSKTTGEGISFALSSGRDIGKKILDPNYKMSEIKGILLSQKRQEKILKLFEYSPGLQKYLLKIYINLLKISWYKSFIINKVKAC